MSKSPVDYMFYLPVHEHGYVALIDVMGGDGDVVDAARMSYDRKGTTEDRNLIRYLLRHRHTSPFEMAALKFELKMPIFVARQWVRHRTASLNEVSARYTQLPQEMFIPKEFSVQSTDNKQGRGDAVSPELQQTLHDIMGTANDTAYGLYEELLDRGVAKETAREVLNLNIYTKFVWKMDLHNLMHFLDVRLDPHAQAEIRDYAEEIETLVSWTFPLCHEAFVDYIKESYTCSRMEVELLNAYLTFHRYKHNMTSEDYYTSIDTINTDAGIILSKRELEDFRRRFPSVE